MTAIGENNQHRQKLLLKMQRRSPNHPFARVWVLQCQVKTTTRGVARAPRQFATCC